MTAINVYLDVADVSQRVGTLYSHLRKGRQGTSFRYESEYLSRREAFAIEPALPLSAGDYAYASGLPHSFRDASPDRWGRLLIQKALRAQWAQQNQAPRSITYLLGTSDLTRQGALRFKQAHDTEFQAANADVPKMIALPRLLSAAHRFCKQTAYDSENPHDFEAIKTLLDAGTGSLGGARPKSAVIDSLADGSQILYLAKFPHPTDEWDVMLWEKVCLDIAKRAGIKVPKNKLVPVEGNNVLLLQRFDRRLDGSRIAYMSTMTLLEKEDGDAADYLEIADALSEVSEQTSLDLKELWCRIMLSLAINNTDDHLRNHGLLRGKNGWQLSPVFDINPEPRLEASRVTSINAAVNFDLGYEAILNSAEWFGLSQEEAKELEVHVVKAVSQWKDIARGYGARTDELRLFAPVFERILQRNDG